MNEKGEREKNQANHKIPLATTHIKRRRDGKRERFAVSNVPIVSSNVFVRSKMY